MPIVVIENIARLREQGQSPLQAARNGASEVAGAITASTLTTIAVFLPITLVEGLAGRLFRDQSLAVVCSLLASLLVALTVVPLIVSRERQTTDRPVYKSDAGSRLLTRYGQALSWSLDHRWTVMMFCALLLMGAGFIDFKFASRGDPRDGTGACRCADYVADRCRPNHDSIARLRD